jgi:hypothetical protein
MTNKHINEEYCTLVDKLEDLVEGKESSSNFDDEELKILRDMMGMYAMFISWGKLGRKLGRFLIWGIITLAAVLTAISQIGGEQL